MVGHANASQSIEMSHDNRWRQLSQPAAVAVRQAKKSYNSSNPILFWFDMTVLHGSMYGLLGSSGCGKTTALSCILGQQKLDSGEVRVFGERPGTKGSGIPGRNVGYMPQEISLLPQFSIAETLFYFGGLVAMHKDHIRKRIDFLLTLLDLPDRERRVSALSGGQQRRVSLAVALIHSPRLIILDEPTVGVDPLLRHRIWEHLKELVAVEQTTIIITTHYIEECRRANRIGVMVGGRLLTEDSPVELFLKHGLNSLESIVLMLCKQNQGGGRGGERPYTRARSHSIASLTKSMTHFKLEKRKEDGSAKNNWRRIFALVTKNVTVQARSPMLMFMVVIFPSLILFLICLCLGKNAANLGLGIVNEEVRNYTTCQRALSTPTKCVMEQMSCQFISSIRDDDFNLTWYRTTEEAIKATIEGEIWGYVNFPPDFSGNFVRRMISRGDGDELHRNSSKIRIQLDETNSIIATTIKTNLYSTYGKFVRNMLLTCGYDERIGDHSLKYHDPIFGTDDTDFGEFMVASMSPVVTFFYPIVTTSIRLIGEKKSGLLSRSLVIGVTNWEIMTAHIISELVVLVLQTLLAYCVIAVMFNITVVGSPAVVLSIFMLSSYGGVSMGLLLATVCSEEFTGAIVAISIFFPMLFLSGIMWPVEGMHIWLQYVVQVFPSTLSGEAVRSVISRGWEFSHPHVWPGVAVPSGYIAVLLLFTSLLVRSKGY